MKKHLFLIIFLTSCQYSHVKMYDQLQQDKIAYLKSDSSLTLIDGKKLEYGLFTVYDIEPGFHELEWQSCFDDEGISDNGLDILGLNTCSNGKICFEASPGETYNFNVSAYGARSIFFDNITFRKNGSSHLASGQRVLYKGFMRIETEVRYCDCSLKKCGPLYRCDEAIDLKIRTGGMCRKVN